MSLSAAEAAKQVGMTKAGIIKAIRTGKLSATKNLNGEWEIEPVELYRVYQPVSTEPSTVSTNYTDNQSESLQKEINLLREIISKQEEVIQNLFDRLAAQQQVTLMLTTEKPPEPEAVKGWWARMWGR